MYDLSISNQAKRQLSKLSSELQYRIGVVFERIRIRPFSHVKRKQGTPYFILRIGNYRAILDIKKDKLIIIVIELGPRNKIYK